MNLLTNPQNPEPRASQPSGGCAPLAGLKDATRKRILLADDDGSVRDSLARLLDLEGFEVIKAVNGRETISLFSSYSPDLVLLDLNMPVEDGWKAFGMISNAHPFVPVIVITARPNQYDRGVAAGVDALMEKPLDLPILLRAIRRLIHEPQKTRFGRLTGRHFKTISLKSSAL